MSRPYYNVNSFTTDPVNTLYFATAPYWSNLPFLIFDIRALWPNAINKNSGLDQFDAGPFEQQQFGTAVVEGVN